ncbi:MAG: hypothetical protein ACI8VJ_000842, partial [Polaribacter sp.]
MQILPYIIQQTQLPSKSIENTIMLLNEDATIPFISRYRKERTGNLDEVQIGEIVKFKALFEALEKRKKAILKALEEQQVLTSELAQKVTNTKDLISLEDLYLPYKKKRKTKAETARLQGLEPLAKMMMSQRVTNLEQTSSKHLSNKVETIEDALEGARFIMAEWINERTDIRDNIRQQLARFAIISSKIIKSKTN